jgi:hypothetical protein
MRCDHLVAVADLDMPVLGHRAHGASGQVVGDEQAGLLGDVHRIRAVLDAPGFAVEIPDHAPHHLGRSAPPDETPASLSYEVR